MKISDKKVLFGDATQNYIFGIFGSAFLFFLSPTGSLQFVRSLNRPSPATQALTVTPHLPLTGLASPRDSLRIATESLRYLTARGEIFRQYMRLDRIPEHHAVSTVAHTLGRGPEGGNT